MFLREIKDIADQTALNASCMAALSGNSSIDVKKISGRISELLEKTFQTKFPYLAAEMKYQAEDHGQYDKYFEKLREINRKKKEEAEKKATQDESDQKSRSDQLKDQKSAII